jgi:hypothetical protein
MTHRRFFTTSIHIRDDEPGRLRISLARWSQDWQSFSEGFQVLSQSARCLFPGCFLHKPKVILVYMSRSYNNLHSKKAITPFDCIKCFSFSGNSRRTAISLSFCIWNKLKLVRIELNASEITDFDFNNQQLRNRISRLYFTQLISVTFPMH